MISLSHKLDNFSSSVFNDLLTGLPTVSLLEAFVKDAGQRNYTVLHLKLKKFKNVNQLYGRRFGDYIIFELANKLKELESRCFKFIKGYSCDFYVVCNTTNDVQVRSYVSLIKQCVANFSSIKSKSVKLSCTLSGTKVFARNIDFDSLIRELDIASQSSAGQRELITFATTRLISSSISDLRLQQKLLLAIESKLFHIQYQPQIDSHGELCGVEALARWSDNELGNIPADKFISIAENIGVINELGKIITEKAFQEFANIRKLLKKDISISINISVHQLLDDDFTFELIEQLNTNNLLSSMVTLEITEGTNIYELEKVVAVLGYLKYMGFTIALDDFGTGYSSVELLSILPIDELKVDKSISKKMLTSEEHLSMLTGILSIGAKMKMQVVVEGVENQKQRELLELLGVKVFQGYLYSAALGKDELIKTYQG